MKLMLTGHSYSDLLRGSELRRNILDVQTCWTWKRVRYGNVFKVGYTGQIEVNVKEARRVPRHLVREKRRNVD
jgi:hypothetical protein